MKFKLLISLALFLILASSLALAWSPYDDIDLFNQFNIINGSSIDANELSIGTITLGHIYLGATDYNETVSSISNVTASVLVPDSNISTISSLQILCVANATGNDSQPGILGTDCIAIANYTFNNSGQIVAFNESLSATDVNVTYSYTYISPPSTNMNLSNISNASYIYAEYLNLTDDINMGGTITMGYGETISNLLDGWIKVTGKLDIEGDTNITGDLNVSDNTILNNANITGKLNITGSTKGSTLELSGFLTVNENSQLEDLNVSGKTNITGQLTGSIVYLYDNLTTLKDIIVTGIIYGDGPVEIVGGLEVTGGLNATGDSYINGSLNVTGIVTASGASMGGDLNMNDNLILNIGDSDTDFDSYGGLTLAAGLVGHRLNITGKANLSSIDVYGTIDTLNNIITNIGNAGTDFNTDGGLTIAAGLNITNQTNMSSVSFYDNVTAFKDVIITGRLYGGSRLRIVEGIEVSGPVNATGTSFLENINITDTATIGTLSVADYALVEDDIPTLSSTWDNTMDADRLTGTDFLNDAITIQGENITDGTIDNARISLVEDEIPALTGSWSNTLDASKIANEGWVDESGDTMTGYLIAPNLNVTGVGGLNVTWNITAKYIDANQTWTHQSYPDACPAGALTKLGDTVTCTDSWVELAGDLMTGDLILDKSGSSVNSPNITFIGDSGGTEVQGVLQVLYGADPYLRISVDDGQGANNLTSVLDIHDTVLSFPNDATVDIGSSGSGRPKDIYASGGITANDINSTGNINITKDLNIGGNFTGNQIYAEIFYHNHTATILGFDIQDVYYNITHFSNSTLNGFAFNGSEYLTAQFDGLYLVNWMGIGEGQNNHKYVMSVSINGLVQPNLEGHKKLTTGGDILTMNGVGFLRLNENDEIRLAVKDDDGTGNGNVYGFNLNLVRIGN